MSIFFTKIVFFTIKNQKIMFKNYLKITLAVMRRRKFYTFISLFGISLTLTVLIVITSFFDNLFASVSADFEAHFAKSLQQLGKDWTGQINHMDEMKKDKNENIVLPLIIAFIVCGFLIINVAFGLFGVLFQNITRRRGEIGVRRAMGATGNNIRGQFIGEMLVLATFSLALGVFFAVQFPILNVFDVPASVYILGILLAVLSVYLLVVLCAWFPSRQAAAIHLAVALHDE